MKNKTQSDIALSLGKAKERKETREEANKRYWDNIARARELAQMDNQPMTEWDTHESY